MAAAAAAAAAGAGAEATDIPVTDLQERMDYDLLKALRRGDEGFVTRFISPQTASSDVADHAVAIGLLDSDDNDIVVEAAGRRSSWRGVTTDGNSALHVVADFGHLNLAKLISAADGSLLAARNAAGETPLHCAARAGADRIVSLFISVANQFEAVLRAKDREGKTALHVAAEEGRAAAARVLTSALPGLAAAIDDKGVSPLYVAVLSGSLEVVQILIVSRQEASYGGPNGQTALHAAAMIESPEITAELLHWKPTLAKKADNSGSTPLHYLATSLNSEMARQLLNHDTSLAYLSDVNGLCAIHVAAGIGSLSVIRELIDCCPDMDGLADYKGRSFLHIAVENMRAEIVEFVCRRPLFVKMVNARDCEGNTPLHLAVKSKSRTIVGFLLANRSVHPSVTNKHGQTPLDVAVAQLDFGFVMKENPHIWIYWCLKGVGAICGPHRPDYLMNENVGAQPNLEKELKKYESTAQSLAIVSVLIATVTFAAAFTMPGGYGPDGTPALAKDYAFKAFMIADFLAFVCSAIATMLLMYAGSLRVDPSLRVQFIRYSLIFLTQASQGMVAAFALSVYVVLAPTGGLIGVVICTVCFPSMVFTWAIWQRVRLARVLKSRLGWSGMCKTQVAGQPRGHNMVNCYCYILGQIPRYLLLYIIVFLLPLLLNLA
uniref:PGG domain-containing protein n=1 Tax=Ananas comosus var. bracteatus TaxID=296719 RepID=A0A6V7PJP5_ANACO|nr:unnamed protein product [Ananas comosus var. bracteatus]